MLSRYVALVLSEWFSDGSSRPCYYWYHFLLSHSTSAEFLSQVFFTGILKSFQLLSWSHFCHQELQHLLTCYVPCLFQRIMLSGLLLGIVLSVRTCWFRNTLPHGCFDWFWYMVIPVLVEYFYPCFLGHVKLQLSAHSFVSLYVLFFLSVLGVLLWFVPLSHQIVDIVCFCSLSFQYLCCIISGL